MVPHSWGFNLQTRRKFVFKMLLWERIRLSNNIFVATMILLLQTKLIPQFEIMNVNLAGFEKCTVNLTLSKQNFYSLFFVVDSRTYCLSSRDEMEDGQSRVGK